MRAHSPKGVWLFSDVRDEKAHKSRDALSRDVLCGQVGRQVCRQAEVPGPQVPRNTVSGLVKPMKGQTIQGVAGPALKVNP